MENTTHVLINILAILFNILFLQYTLYKRNLEQLQIERAVFMMISVMIAANILFPIELGDGFIFNLSLIPLAFGCFYAMRFLKIWVFFLFLFLALRFIEGNDYLWLTISTVLLFCLLFILFRKRFQSYSMKERLHFLAVTMLFISVWWLACVYYFYHISYSALFCLAYIFSQTGGIYVFGYILETVRQQHALLSRIVKMEKMEVVSHLAASISHEVRNPLTTARGFMQLLGEMKDAEQRQKEYISIALQELDRADSIIRDYLTFAKPAPENMEEMEIKEEIEKSLQLIEPLASMNGVQLKREINSCSIKGNRGLFQQVLINILKNGIEAMPNGGELTITCFQKDSTIHITIKDEGIGMTEEQKNRLGEPYFSLKDGKGTGLGMMVVYRIVETMKGKIRVTSEQGKGTGITLLFPSINEKALNK
ncbi:GHKL domain-containing protein [Neobacillus cucumis]|uniref:ATP-binding protein n=1 Tax=Neobacillus cucumis TaxID=1740721 RepID=UPI0018DF8847|nr:ATP-binding protein [Neobacillus cucumis]MBI0575867.1 GHKL domain-containing protein [Neobacillus cucumis]